jgi:hypothetical protein
MERAYSPYNPIHLHFLGRYPRLVWSAPSALYYPEYLSIQDKMRVRGRAALPHSKYFANRSEYIILVGERPKRTETVRYGIYDHSVVEQCMVQGI